MTIEIIVAIITSILTSILVGRFYLNRQYHESNSGFRQARILIATREFKNHILNNEGLSISALREKHRNSLGLVIERCIRSFGVNAEDTVSGKYPLLYNPKDKNGWEFYKEHIHSVIIDLNNNAFIGWVPWILNVKRMRTLWYFSHTIEEIIETQEILRDYEDTQGIKIFVPKNDGYSISISTTGQEAIDTHIDQYKISMENLKRYWLQWQLLL